MYGTMKYDVASVEGDPVSQDFYQVLKHDHVDLHDVAINVLHVCNKDNVYVMFRFL